MGFGSQNKQTRQEFTKIVKQNWKTKIVDIASAEEMIKTIESQTDPTLLSLDQYAQRKLASIRAFIAYLQAGGTEFANYAEFKAHNPNA